MAPRGFMAAKHRFCRALWEFFWKRELVSNVSSNGAICELEVGSEGRHGNATVNRYEMPYQSRESDPFRKLQEAKEDWEIALNLLKKVEENLDLIADSEEKLHEKRDALAGGIKRLEEKTTTVEMWQKKTKLALTERIIKLEIYQEQSIRFNSIIRQINQKIAKIGTSEIINRREKPPSSTVKLPKMELKTFDGNVLKWYEFWENFEHCVHNQPLVQELQKFSYLKSCLKGPAFVCISNFELRAENYGPAVQLLEDRYGHKNVLRKAHLDSLEKLAPVSNSRDIPRLKRLYEDVESHYKALLAVNVMPHEYMATIVPKLLEKLPIDIRIKINETKDENEDLTIDELVEELRKIVKIRGKRGVQLKENFGEIKRFKEKRN